MTAPTVGPYRTNRAAALVVVRHAASRADARRLLEILGIVAEGGHELRPDDTTANVIPGLGGKAPAQTDGPPRRRALGEPQMRNRDAVPAGLRDLPPVAAPQTPTKKAPRPKPSAAAGTAPGRSRPGHGKAAPGAGTQVSPSRSHRGTGGGLGAPDATAGPPTTRRRPGPVPTSTCGSPAAYRRHLRDGERPCQPCLDAEAARQRRQLGPDAAVRGPAKCGTPSGYRKHRRAGEDACRPCKASINAYIKGRIAARRQEAQGARQ